MDNDLYSLLDIPSPEAEQVRRILQPAGAQAAPRQIYGDPGLQSVSDYHAAADQDYQRRSDLAHEAEITRQATLPTAMGQQARVAAYRKALQAALYEKQTGALLKDLHALDPADPEHELQQDEIFARHPIAHQALSDPRVASTVKRQAAEYQTFQRLFDTDPAARHEYAALKAEQVDPVKARETVRQNSLLRAQREAFAKAGGDLAEFDQFVQPDKSVDRAAVAQHLAQRARVQKIVSTPSIQKQLLELQSAAERAASTEPSDLQKQAWLAAQGIADPKEEDWARAYDALKTGPVQALQTFRQSLGLDPATPPPNAGGAAAPPPSSSPSLQPEAAAAVIPVIKTHAEYDALPSGATFTANGKTYRKK